MAAAPPAYTAGSSPPSYDEVAAKLETLVGDNPTPDTIVKATAQLSDEEINVLTDGADDHWPIETDKQKKEFEIGCGQTISSPEAKAHLEQEGIDATRATVNIRDNFRQLHLRLSRIDLAHNSGFGPEISRLGEEYARILAGSRDLAIRISVQAKRFDDRIVAACSDDTIPVETRGGIIGSYIEGVASFEGDAQGVSDDYDRLTRDFGAFVEEFSKWAKDKEGEITEQIRDVERRLADLHTKLYRLESSLIAFELLFGASIPATGKLMKMFPKFAPWIAIGGVITAGVSFITIAGLLAGISATKTRIFLAEQEKERLLRDLENIREARAELEHFGDSSLTQFYTATSVLTGTWGQTLSDARDIQEWLAKGADAEHRPGYMELSQRHHVRKFDSMAVFLDNYARGITS